MKTAHPNKKDIQYRPLSVSEVRRANLHITDIISSREKRIPYACVHMNDAWCGRPSLTSSIIGAAPAPRLLTASGGILTLNENPTLSQTHKVQISFELLSERWHADPRAREDPCQTLAKSLTDAGRGVFDMKGLVWYGGQGGILPVMNRQWALYL